jgi:hypothetical protein
MKTTTNTIVIFLFAGLFIISCENEKTGSQQLKITGNLVNNSACKNELKSNSGLFDTPDSLSCIEYSFDDLNNKLTIKHINAGFNCCPDSLYCNVSLSNDTVIIEEFEASALCNCDCLYDLDMELDGVIPQKYHIRFIEPYAQDQEKLIFDIDLTKVKEESFCVTRKGYPWGMNSR